MPGNDRAPDLRRLPIAVNPRAISLAEGIRAGLSVAVIIGAAEYIDFPPLREAALAALLTCLCDPGGPIRRRVPILLGFTAAGAAITAGFGLLRGFGPEVAVIIGVLGLFCASLARVYGQAPQQLGGLLCVVMILSLDHAIADPMTAAILAGSFIAGALWATVLTMVIWRIYPFLPARRAVADAYRQLSELIRDLQARIATPGITDEDWEAHARIHRGSVRAAIEAARAMVLDTLRARGIAGNRAGQSLIRLEAAEQVFGAIIAFSDLLEQAPPDQRASVAPILRRLRPVLLVLGQIIVTDDPDAHTRIDRAIDAILADAAALPPASAFRRVIARITERLRIAHNMSVPANFDPGSDSAGKPLPLRQRLIHPLRDNLDWRSPVLRHAARIAATAIGPLIVTMIWFTPYDHWLTITVVATMQPYFALTLTRAIERIAGTAAGGLLAAAIGFLCTTPIVMAAAMFPLAVAALAIRAVSFGLFMMTLTPLIVLLVETGQPGTSGWRIAIARATLTTAGGLIAVAANFLLWPSREPDLVEAEVRKSIAAHGAYADAAFTTLLGGPEQTRTAARADAGIATNALEALISRALLDPGRGKRDTLEAAMVIDAALRRTAGRLAALPYDPAPATALSSQAIGSWRHWITTSLRALADGRTPLEPRPATDETEAMRRIARQIELIEGALPRLSG